MFGHRTNRKPSSNEVAGAEGLTSTAGSIGASSSSGLARGFETPDASGPDSAPQPPAGGVGDHVTGAEVKPVSQSYGSRKATEREFEHNCKDRVCTQWDCGSKRLYEALSR